MSLGAIKEKLDNLTEREKILSIVLLSIFCVTIAAVSFALVKKKTGDLEDTIEANESILSEIKDRKADIKRQLLIKEKQEERFEKAPPQLLGLLERLAGDVGIEIPESRDLPDETISKKWIHNSVEIRLRRIGLDTLVKFMEKVKDQNRKFPLAVTKMNIKKRRGEPNSFDVEMTVSTYFKKVREKKAKKKEKDGKEKDEREEPSTGEEKMYGPEY